MREEPCGQPAARDSTAIVPAGQRAGADGQWRYRCMHLSVLHHTALYLMRREEERSQRGRGGRAWQRA